MSGPSRHKEKHKKSREYSSDKHNDETAARTRPFSYDEIMLTRKNKKLSGDVAEEAGEWKSKGKDTAENYSQHDTEKFNGHTNDFSIPLSHKSEAISKPSSRRKEEIISVKEDNLAKGIIHQISRASGINLKSKLDKDTDSKSKGEKSAKQYHRRRKDGKSSACDSDNEFEWKHPKRLSNNESYASRRRGNAEGGSKRRQLNRDDKVTRDVNAAKKPDSGKRHHLGLSVRKESKESLHSRNKGSRVKRKWSSGQEYEKDEERRSVSPLSRSHKHASHHWQEHGEHSSYSRRQLSDMEKNHMSSNGSNSHHRHIESSSGLGGYSPRKRKTEAAVRTPSPTKRTPERKNVGWKHTPSGPEKTDNLPSLVVPSNLQSSAVLQSNAQEQATADSVASSTANSLSEALTNALSMGNVASVDSILLTQATRPMRRLYIYNVPPSSSEEALMEWLNTLLMSSTVNHIQGTKPCISCNILKDKGQALVEFLTSEDASAALSFNGSTFCGSVLKIKRPKDFLDVTTGATEKAVAVADVISDIVKDSPHKIFIGGISKSLSSKMIMDVASAFGCLKAYHFQLDGDLEEPFAFLEYVDPSVTLKACAGLNGMKLGGQPLTAVQAIPDASLVDDSGNPPQYPIPNHAKPLLAEPTEVLKLQNVFNPVNLSSLSEAEIDEVLEDIRLECARFGTVKSVNVVKCSSCRTSSPEVRDVVDLTECSESRQGSAHGGGGDEHEIGEVLGENESGNDKRSEDEANANNMETIVVDDTTFEDQAKSGETKVADTRTSGERAPDSQGGLREIGPESIEKGGGAEHMLDSERVFEPGCVLVEYARVEASSMAAHCLHGRLYDNEMVAVEYVPLDYYQARFAV